MKRDETADAEKENVLEIMMIVTHIEIDSGYAADTEI